MTARNTLMDRSGGRPVYPVGAVAKAAAVLGLSLSLVACGGHSATRATGRATGAGPLPDASPSKSAPPASKSPLSGDYSAAQLFSWVPAHLYPADLTEYLIGFHTTGSVVKVDAQFTPGDSCSTVFGYTGGEGWGEQAYFTDTVWNSNPKKADFYTYVMYEFPTAGQAAALVRGIAAKYSACGASSTAALGGDIPIHLSVGPAPKVSGASVTADIRESETSSEGTAVGEFLLAADGNVVVLVGQSSFAGNASNQVDESQVAASLLAGFAHGEAAYAPGSTETGQPVETWEPVGARAYAPGSVYWGGERI
jgi:hypothetical protein